MKRIGFIEMSDIIETVLEKAEFMANPGLEDYIFTNASTRDATQLLIDNRK